MRKRFLLLLAVLLPAAAQAAGDWSEVWRDQMIDGALIRRYQFRSTTAVLSEALDVRHCTGGLGVRMDPSALDTSENAVPSLLSCDDATTTTLCREVINYGGTAAGLLQRWSPGPDRAFLQATGRYLRARIAPTPVGGDIAVVDVECYADGPSEGSALALGETFNHTELSFQHLADTSCNSALCSPNDAVTPTWVRTAIGAAAADLLSPDTSAVQLTGEAHIEPGTAASTGVQYTLTAGQALTLDFANRERRPFKAMVFRASFWRTGATAVPFIGLCGITPGGTASAALTTAAAFTAGPAIGVRWDAAGTFTSAVLGTINTTATTAQTFTSLNYHEVSIVAERNLGIDVSANLEIDGDAGTSGNPYSLKIYVDGVLVQEVDDIVGPNVSFATAQLAPCMAAVNSGGTADTVNVADLDWWTPKRFPVADDN